MIRIETKERDNWQHTAEAMGFKFHTIDGEKYWDESAYYQFTLQQIERDIEDPTQDIHNMCLEIVDEVVNSEEKLSLLSIPEQFWDQVRLSWLQGHPNMYGRMDFSYSGKGPAKLLELNYDTPTSLFEAGSFQYGWLEDMIASGRLPAHADQFNSLHEKLLNFFFSTDIPLPLYLSSVRDSEEDRGTIQYLQDIAHQAGLPTQLINIEDIGYNKNTGNLIDLAEQNIPSLFKLYPWEHIFLEEFGQHIPSSQTLFIEPTWKSIISNKGILPLLWDKFKGHPNLLETHFDTNPNASLGRGWVRKPFFSREGANIEILTPDNKIVKVDGPYTDSPYILQEFSPLPQYGDSFTLIGSWTVGDQPAGIGIREDSSLITKDSSRFLPHVFID
jgi:glutathionylspermidine synthase